jgi:hypothetical protein
VDGCVLSTQALKKKKKMKTSLHDQKFSGEDSLDYLHPSSTKTLCKSQVTLAMSTPNP